MGPSVPKSRCCCVCGKSRLTNSGTRLHLFPRDPTRRKEWLKRVNLTFEKDSQAICEDHFDDCYRASKGRLLPNAIPHVTDEDCSKDSYEEDMKPVMKDVGTDMLEDPSSNTTVKLPQYDSFGTDFGMVPNPFESGDLTSQQPQGEISLPLSPHPEPMMDDVSEDPLSPSYQPLTKPILSDMDSGKDEATDTPKKVVRHLHHYFTDVEMLTIAQGVEKRTNIILGKLDAKNTTATKNSAWEEVTKEVNAVSQIKRTAKEISEKFHLMRISLKKKISAVPQQMDGRSDDPASQGAWKEWENILLQLPRPTNNIPPNTGGKNLPSTSGTIKKFDQTSLNAVPNIEESIHNSNSVGDGDSDDSLPPTYSGSGNKAVIVIDGEEHEIRIFDAPAEKDIKTQECISDKSTNTTTKGIESITTKQSNIHHNRSKAGNRTMMAEFLRAQDEMRDLLEELVKTQHESTTATQRAAAAISQCAQAQIASAEAVRASASALTTLASSMKEWLQRQPQRRKM